MTDSQLKQYSVYIHRNTINDKRYIGITSKPPAERWGRGGWGYYTNKHFSAAIKKYGWNAFEHIVVACDLSVEDAGNMERELIAFYKSDNPCFGYNVCAGGETNILPQSSLDKISQKNKGRKMTDEVKKRRAENPNPPKARKVVCDGKEFRSITDCAKYYGVNPRTMGNWFLGRGYVPQFFVDKQISLLGAEIEYIPCQSKRLWVFCDEKAYPSVSEFCRQEHISLNTVNGWFYGKYRMREDYKQRNLHRRYQKLYKIVIKEK